MMMNRFCWILLCSILVWCCAPQSVIAQEGRAQGRQLVLNAVGDCAHPIQFYYDDLQAMGYRVHEAVKPILAQGDLNFINLETPITSKEPVLKKWFVFTAPFASLQEMGRAGFNLFSIANNHMGDAGEAGIWDTEVGFLRLAAKRPTYWAGAGTHSDGVFFTVPGHRQKIAFLAWGNEPNVAEFKIDMAEKAVRKAATRADLVLVSVHGGPEYQHIPETKRIEAYRRLIDAGATVVLGHHPHSIQGVELRGQGVIFYSLGNYSLCSKTIRHHRTGAKLYGMLPTIIFSGTDITDIQITPLYVNNKEPMVVINQQGKHKLAPTPFQPQIAKGVFAEQILDSLAQWSGNIPDNRTRFLRKGEKLHVILSRAEKSNLSRVQEASTLSVQSRIRAKRIASR